MESRPCLFADLMKVTMSSLYQKCTTRLDDEQPKGETVELIHRRCKGRRRTVTACRVADLSKHCLKPRRCDTEPHRCI